MTSSAHAIPAQAFGSCPHTPGQGLRFCSWLWNAHAARCRSIGGSGCAPIPTLICHNCLDGLNGQRNGQLQLISGSWLVTGFEPVFKVTDVSSSIVWFSRAGFDVSFHDET